MTIYNFNLLPSKNWERIYWNQGSDAALTYCNQVAKERDQFLNKVHAFSRFPIREGCPVEKTQESFLNICSFYEKKIKKYCGDCKRGNAVSRGRGEPGRTPLNFRPSAERFSSFQAFQEFCVAKSKSHKETLEAFNYLSRTLALDDETQIWVSDLQKIHAESTKKWDERQSGSPLSQTYFSPVNPLCCTEIDWLHEQGYLGEEGKCIVMECNGADTSHPSLSHAFLNSPQIIAEVDCSHGTHVCGIIAGKENEPKGFPGGGAPHAKIELVFGLEEEMSDALQSSSISIVNFSGGFINPYPKLLASMGTHEEFACSIQNMMPEASLERKAVLLKMFDLSAQGKEEELREWLQELHKSFAEKFYKMFFRAFSSKLVIAAIGNEGVNVQENPCHYFSFMLLPIAEKSRKIILVVNVTLNALGEIILDRSSETPGNLFASKTVCAPGRSITSCLPGNQFGSCTGTSMAAPFVTSLAVDIQSAFPKLTMDQIKKCILEGATPIVLVKNKQNRLVGRLVNPENLKDYPQKSIQCSRRFFGMGLLNAKRSIELAKKLG